MQIALKPEQEKFILEKLSQGDYKTVDELLTVAFQLLEEHDRRTRKLAELRQKIAEGTKQIEQGEVVDGEAVFQQLQEKLNKIQ
ncbi:MAG: type II toxin-antitoxin system ParD family antitoxin [Leptolyngbyaceae cyanobacterium SL_5_9]|nr:type II toxin-antitoxin system ParD family antitoxin [Leptolyngbyaceae cyanobacterium SL_5_9]